MQKSAIIFTMSEQVRVEKTCVATGFLIEPTRGKGQIPVVANEIPVVAK